jgi:dipeptidase E
VKLLLTSAGVANASIRAALVELLGRPIEDSNVLAIPTAQYGHPSVGPGPGPWRFISGRSPHHMTDLGWSSVGVLELTALPSLPRERWVPLVEATDALVVSGGDALYLAHWMRESGLDELLPSLRAVWLGMSAGSMVLTPRIGQDFVGWRPPGSPADGPVDDRTLGVVDFHICPHVAPDGMPGNTMAEAEAWAAAITGPAYAIDDQTAFRVVDGTVDVISEGAWTLLHD